MSSPLTFDIFMPYSQVAESTLIPNTHLFVSTCLFLCYLLPPLKFSYFIGSIELKHLIAKNTLKKRRLSRRMAEA